MYLGDASVLAVGCVKDFIFPGSGFKRGGPKFRLPAIDVMGRNDRIIMADRVVNNVESLKVIFFSCTEV